MLLLLLSLGCGPETLDTAALPHDTLSPSDQRPGDPDAGWEYLLYGDYIGSGIPVDTFRSFFGSTSANPLERTGPSASIPYVFNHFDAPNGVPVVGGLNCFACHSSTLNGTFIVGLGETFSDYTVDQSGSYSILSSVIAAEYGEDSPEVAAYTHLGKGAAASGPYLVTPFVGVNPAFSLEASIAVHRDPVTLTWRDEPGFTPSTRVASDVPPWWNIGKKHGLYYNAIGRGDKARLIMQTCIVGVWDADHAAEIDAHFPDVLAWLETLEPPVYPGALDNDLVDAGAAIFAARCSGCHGTYDADPAAETYPNRMVSVDEVGTDPLLAETYLDRPDFTDWLSESWFASYGNAAEFKAMAAYIAPPLDGIWATAPYLHNGSVPDLYALLDSSQRPSRWRRDFSSSAYDLDRVGWPHEVVEAATDASVYDATRTGYTNTGHTYGDSLTDDERGALVEYLKSL